MAKHKKPVGKIPQAKLIEQNLWDLDDDDHVEILETPVPNPSAELSDDNPAEKTEEICVDLTRNDTINDDSADHLSEDDHATENDFEDEQNEGLSDIEEPLPQDPRSPEDDFEIEKIDGLEDGDVEDTFEDDKAEDTLEDSHILGDLDDDDVLDLDISSESPEEINTALSDKTSSRKTGTSLLTRLSIVEKASLGLFVLLLIGFFIWLAASYTPPTDWITQKAPPVSFPVNGKTLTIEEVKTAWREPVRSGKARDSGIRLDTRLIPIADVTVGGGSGQLRFIFQNADGEIIGDTITKKISSGQFGDQVNTAEIHGTDGFEDNTLFNNYAQKEIRPWTLSIYEVNDQQADSKALLTVPIAADLKKNP